MSDGDIGNSQQHVAAELKRVRESAGLSQEQMARRLGMDYAPGGRKVSTGRAAVSAWERGRRLPSVQYLRAYVALGGDPAVLTSPADSWQRESAIDIPAADYASDGDPILAGSAQSGLGAGRFSRRGPRLQLLAVLSAIVLAVLGAVLCRVRGYVVPDGDPWWYRLASAPWNGNYYATSDAFYNNGSTSGNVVNGVIVDQQVPICAGN